MKILFEDTHLVVLNKPAGLLSQGEITGDENLVDLMRVHFGRNYVGLVHRLDRNTSGLMVVGKRSKSADRLSDALRSGKLVRKYQALVWGKISQPQHWIHYLLKNEKTNTVSVSKESKEGWKKAELNLDPIKILKLEGREVSLVEFTLETGRSHQIRAQCSYEGFSLVGDPKYANAEFLKLNKKYERQALHSSYLSFPHPMSKEKMEFKSILDVSEFGL